MTQQDVLSIAASLPLATGVIIPSMSDEAIGKVRNVEDLVNRQVQLQFHTEHIIHGGIYFRTILMPVGSVFSFALIKESTTVIFMGSVSVYVGDGAPIQFEGYNILPASANRKVATYAHTDVTMTMLLATDAQSVEEAEKQVTDEVDLIASHRDENTNSVLITGE